MTREEIIKEYEAAVAAHAAAAAAGIKGAEKSYELFKAGLDALRPVSREQVEKVFHGCEMCREEKKVKSDNFCGAATMRIVGDSIDLRGDEKKIKFFGHIYAPSFSVKFCPFCGAPMTDEAAQMVMERLEALHGETD